MIDLTKMQMHLAAEPHRAMSDAERQYYAERLPECDLTPAITVTTRGGGNLTLASDGDFVHLKADLASDKMFMISCFKPQFDHLMAGGVEHLPGVGRLVATPIGRDRVRLVLLPERKGSKGIQGGAFEADLRLSEIMARL